MRVPNDKSLRWIHIVLSVLILGYIYGPVASMPVAANLVRFVFDARGHCFRVLDVEGARAGALLEG